MPLRIAYIGLGAAFLCALLLAAEFDLVEMVATGHRRHQEVELEELVVLSGLFSLILGLLLAWKAVALGSERRERRAVERLASVDALTGLANRRAFNERLDHSFERARRGSRCAVLLIDLDGFKAINDTHGHAAGDRLLVHVAQQIGGLVGDGDVAARLGGDEFAILLEGWSATPEHVRALTARLPDAIGRPLLRAGEMLRVGASIGSAIASSAISSSAALMEAADSAMYRDKRAKRVAGPFEARRTG